MIGIKDAKWGERPMALVVLKSGATATEADIKAHVKAFAEEGHISKFAIPEHVLFPPAIDKTSVGKINKMNLRARYENA